jgi:hypothetical protein
MQNPKIPQIATEGGGKSGETSAYADTLGVSHLDADEQVSIVKRHKDRLKKMLQRHINRSELYENG